MLDAALGSGKPLVIDADAINLLAASGSWKLPQAVLTPHPASGGGCSVAVPQRSRRDRPAALRRLAELTGSVVVLKGAGTADRRGRPGQRVCTRGNPGMAAPGMAMC